MRQQFLTMRPLVREVIETIVLSLLIFLAVRFTVQNYRVEGPSMDPALSAGQHLLVNRLVYLRIDSSVVSKLVSIATRDSHRYFSPFDSPNRGDIVVFRFPGENRDFVKRVIGIPGDTIHIENGLVVLNGEVLKEPYIIHYDGGNMDPIKVTHDTYFGMGDNRQRSDDSRPRKFGFSNDWRPVPAENVIGRAWLRYWPLDEWRILSN